MGGDYTFPIILNEVENYTGVLTIFYGNEKVGRREGGGGGVILGGVIIHGERLLSHASLSLDSMSLMVFVAPTRWIGTTPRACWRNSTTT